MKFLRNIQLKAGLFFLRRHAGKIQRNKSILGFSQVNSVALLLEITESGIPPAAEQFTKTLKQEHKKVHQFIFYSGDHKKLNLVAGDDQVLFSKKDLNLFFKPSASLTEKLDAINADYIIDINLMDSFPMIFLAGTSRARLRIGRHSEMRLPYFDVMISEKTENQQEFYQHLLHYLKILNPFNHE